MNAEPDIYPRVSVLMPIRNEATVIRRSLGAVVDQHYVPELLEIIVVDGLSTDGTREIVKNFQAHHLNVRLIDNPQGIVATAMNAGIRVAQGDVIVRVDGHTIITPNYVRNCVTTLERSGAQNVGGRMLAVSNGLIGEAIAAATSSPFGVGGARFHYSDQEEWVDTVYMGAWRKSVFDQIGLFDEEMVRDQDDELNYRLRAHGGKILLSPSIRSEYFNRQTFRSLGKQYFQYGFWKVRVLQKHPRQMKVRQFVPPLFVFSILSTLVFAPFSPFAREVFGLIAGSYLIAIVAASVMTALQKGSRMFPLLLVAFFTLHFSYGLGFLVGFFRFWGRWGLNSRLAVPQRDSSTSDEIER